MAHPQRPDLTPDLSPSTCHERVELTPRLAFTGQPIDAFQRALRADLRERLGLAAMPPRRRPSPRVVFTREHALGVVEKALVEVEPGADMPVYLCTPKHKKPPYRWALCLQGHSTGMHNSIGVDELDEQTPIDVEGDRDFAAAAMRRGLAAICVEQRALGQRRETRQRRMSYHNPCHDAAMRALLLGRTLLGERVYDVLAALDLLDRRDDVRPGVVAMGNSGGGTVAIYAAALDERIGLLMPSCSLCTLRDSLFSLHHCTDNYVPGLMTVAEMADIAGLVAPRPLVAVAGLHDPIFPIEGVRRAFDGLSRIYEAAGASTKARLVVGPEGHRFYADLAWPVALELLGDEATSGP